MAERNSNELLLSRSDFICGKGFGSSYHMRISLIESMHVGLIIIKGGGSIRNLIGEPQEEN